MMGLTVVPAVEATKLLGDPVLTKTNVKHKRLGALKTQAVSTPPGLIVVNAIEDDNYRITNARISTNAPLGNIPALEEHSARTRSAITSVPGLHAPLDKNSVPMGPVNPRLGIFVIESNAGMALFVIVTTQDGLVKTLMSVHCHPLSAKQTKCVSTLWGHSNVETHVKT